ncbi:MAG: Saccharopine dehydrogenase [Piptocephalis tieghemiana]|nr:MAG: Saccharopine dehydrogenase [Piptocephalis tieghemiana]
MSPSPKHILLLGSGYVAKPTAEFILRRPENHLTIACRRIEAAQELTKILGSDRVKAISLDVMDEAALDAAMEKHDLAVSLIPYIHHARVIESAIRKKKHVVTTSYVNPQMQALNDKAKEAGITCMNEIGLDPGIDHLYAVKTIEEVHKAGGQLKSFLSYCGGLPAPEASNNPLGYKFSWSSRGVLLALRNTAKWLENGKVREVSGTDLMDMAKPIFIYPAFAFVGYANRDSTPYSERYRIPECETILRGTLRYQGFPRFIKALVILGFLQDESVDYLASADPASPPAWKDVLAKMTGASANDEASLKAAVLSKIPDTGEDAERIIDGIRWLGLFSDTPVIPRGGNPLDTLCATLEQKMAYGPKERDMVMLQHRFDIQKADGTPEVRTSTLLAYGVPGGDTAMATTVGIPCGISVQLILDGKLNIPGVIAPMTMDICGPIIEELEKEGISCEEAIL